jgi:hypothetical protein
MGVLKQKCLKRLMNIAYLPFIGASNQEQVKFSLPSSGGRVRKPSACATEGVIPEIAQVPEPL